MDYLNSPAARDLDGAACGEALIAIGAIQSELARRRTGCCAGSTPTPATTPTATPPPPPGSPARTGLGRKDAKATVRQTRLLGRHPLLDDAAADGTVTISWAREMAGWTGKIGDQEMQQDADQILLEAAQAGADLDGLRVIAQAAYEAWRAQHPDDDPPGKGFGDRFAQLDTTMDGAGRLTADLTPECAAAVRAVLDALGKKRGPEDDRTAAQRFHDALQEGCELLIRAKMVPDRAGSDTRVDVVIPLSALRGMPGAPAVEEAWLRARAGRHGYLAGQGRRGRRLRRPHRPHRHRHPRLGRHHPDDHPHHQPPTTSTPPGRDQPPGEPGPARRPQARRSWARSLPPPEQENLLYGLARLAIDFVSGPGGVASALRRTLLGSQLNGKSVPLDAGYSDQIPAAIRHAVIHRDQHCAWPAGCDRPAAVSDVHHIPAQKRRRAHQRQALHAPLPVPPRHLHPPLGMENRTPPRRNRPRHRTPRPDHPKPPPTHHPRRITPRNPRPPTPRPPRPRPEAPRRSRAPATPRARGTARDRQLSRVPQPEHQAAGQQRPGRPQGEHAEALPGGERQAAQPGGGLDGEPGGHRPDLLQLP